jgi:hypothetical protein
MLCAMLPQFLHGLHGRLGIREEVAARGLMDCSKRSAPELSSNPFFRNLKPFGELCDRQTAGDRGPARPGPHLPP